MKKLIIILAVAAMSLAIPASAAMTSLTLRESGNIECQPEDIRTRLTAAGDHRHNVLGNNADIDFEPEPTGFVTTTIGWTYGFGTWKLYNSTGYAYSSSGSYPWCG